MKKIYLTILTLALLVSNIASSNARFYGMHVEEQQSGFIVTNIGPVSSSAANLSAYLESQGLQSSMINRYSGSLNTTVKKIVDNKEIAQNIVVDYFCAPSGGSKGLCFISTENFANKDMADSRLTLDGNKINFTRNNDIITMSLAPVGERQMSGMLENFGKLPDGMGQGIPNSNRPDSNVPANFGKLPSQLGR